VTPTAAAALDAIRSRSVLVTGGPGTGKTTLAVRAVVDEVARGTDPGRVILLAPTRVAAGALRDRISLAIARPTGVALSRTPAALAFHILATAAADAGEPAPALISGAEQDVILRELLAGHREGRGRAPDWSGIVVDEALELEGFRDELRNLMMRAAEADMSPEALARLGTDAGRREWVVAASVYREYLDVLALRVTPGDTGGRFDPASIVARAADELAALIDTPREMSWDLVVVDDYQEATAATAALVDVMRQAGARVLLTGNADEMVQGFRGASAHSLQAIAATGVTHVELSEGRRQAGSLAIVSQRVASKISVAGVGSARAAGRPWATEEPVADGAVTVLTAPHDYAQARGIASELRKARHGLDGAPPIGWGRMVVIARSQAQLRDIRSGLLAADIPCQSLGEGVALHREPAVAPLLMVLEAALGTEWTEDSAHAILTSRVGGLDPVGIRRLRRELVREERAGGGSRSSGELLVEALAEPGRFATLKGPEAVRAAAISAAVFAAAERAAAPAPTPGAVIWAAWQRLGVADEWRQAALAGSARDDADLDAVIALLRAAQTYTERLPHSPARAFLDYLAAQDFAPDVLGGRGSDDDVVTFATPAGAAGREWELVVVAGLEDGVWPNLRLRDSVLGSQRLAEALAAGPAGALDRARGDRDLRQARREVLDDEARALLVAVSRASRRLIVTSVVDLERSPSRFVPLIAEAAGVTIEDVSASRGVADLRDVVARLRVDGARAILAAHGDHSVGPLAQSLAGLARLGEQTADPAAWHGVPALSTAEPFWPDDAPVRVSPSKYDAVRTCPLRWALETAGGTAASSAEQSLGTLVHAVAEAHPNGPASALLAEFEAMWGDPGTTWLKRSEFQRGREMVLKLADYIQDAAGATVHVEQPMHVEIGRAVISGVADRIEVRDGVATVVDLKTGAPITAAQAQDHGQLKLYQLAANAGGFETVDAVAGAALVYLGGGAQSASIRRQEAIDNDEVRAELADVVATMVAPEFAACINDFCGHCPVRRACPAHAEGAQVSE
jgi:superfamily I DNA/RNA helicase